MELCSDFVSNLTWKFLLTKCKQGLFTDKVVGFNNVIRLYGTHAAVSKYNTTWFCDLLQLVVAIKLIDIGVGAQKVTPDQCDTIENLALCIGVKVMLI